MKIVLKVFIIAVLFLNILFIFNTNANYSLAVTSTKDALGMYTNDVEDNAITTPTKKVMGTSISVMRIVGSGIAIIMLVYVAIKYMSAAPQEKAEFKKSATAYVVGAIVLFATTGILGIISKFALTI